MENTSRYRLGDVYLTSALSVAFVVAVFASLKPCEPQSKRLLLYLSVGGWALLETAALVLSLVHDFSNAHLPRGLERSAHLILVTFSMCGLVNVQVSESLPLLSQSANSQIDHHNHICIRCLICQNKMVDQSCDSRMLRGCYHLRRRLGSSPSRTGLPSASYLSNFGYSGNTSGISRLTKPRV
jgi:hypothetical protein